MAGHQKDPLRPLTIDEHLSLEHLSRSRTDPAAQVARAKELLAVADGASYEAAARAAGRRSGDAVAHLVARFNREGIDVVVERHGGGQPKRYTVIEQERILQEVRRTPDRDKDRTATWSLSTLQGALRRDPDGLPHVSTYTIWCVLHESIQRIFKRRALDGQHPKTLEEIMEWLAATARGWNREPTPFVWGGKRKAWRDRARQRRHALGGSGA